MVSLTYFPSLYQTQGKRFETTWERLFARFTNPARCARKEDVAGWSPAIYENDRRAEGSKALALAGLVIEHDDGMSIADAAEVWGEFYGFIYTTFSHTASSPRLRIVLPASRPVTPAEHATVWNWAQDRDPGIDPKARDAKRFWFLPATTPGGMFVWAPLTGALLEVAAVLREHKPPTPAPRPAPAAVHSSFSPAGDVIARARAYLARVPGAVSGAGGHDHTFKVALALTQGFALDERLALDLLSGWNHTCEPPWSVRELEHKIASACNAHGVNRGYLLDRGRAA